jgi:hypothetical protein
VTGRSSRFLIGYGLRRAELIRFDVGPIQQREGRRGDSGLIGKGMGRRTGQAATICFSFPAAIAAPGVLWSPQDK